MTEVRKAPIPHPPRRTGNPASDNQALINWTNDFYRIAILQGGLLQKAEQLAVQETLEDLIDPASATIATAQKTANDALTLANTAENKAEFNQVIVESFGTIEISGTDKTATYEFAEDEEQKDVDYSVVLTPLSSNGTPDINSTLITGQSYEKEKFTITVNSAPGAGASVVFNWHLRRKTEG
ncbi:hypothetical protein [Terasakiella pusilla]|uniref:hypothetical protein n=1 Tax=Terasakiella pusilla TaxID=64973 RepID=UPI003AA9773E